ncbi:MAG: hypothetical protein JWM27_2279 [Gemmatimonadetes bacterium]|nr:hypothetical protein [Gemmatimonadota bacterium]
MRPTEADNFFHVADALLDELDGSPAEVAEWEACANARYRAAISRAYYAVFLEIKYGVLPLRDEWLRASQTFPRHQVHRRFVDAIRAVPDGHRLARDLNQLSKSRNAADYVWDAPYHRTHVEQELKVARRLLGELARLTAREWERAADRLAQQGA